MKMKAIVNTAPGKLALKDWPMPSPGPDEVRVRTAACGICATDLAMIAGWSRTGFPAIPGHEWSGVVDAVGETVDPDLVGRHCVAENVLSDGGEVGFEHPGGYGAYVITEAANIYPLPDDFPLVQAVLIEPLAVSIRAVRRLAPENGRGALIFGDGPIGLLMLSLLVRAGFTETVVVGGRPGRLALAASLGAVQTLNYHDMSGDLTEGVRASSGAGFSNVVEASGSPAAMQASLNLAGQGGRIAVVGDYGDSRADFAWNHLLHREVHLIGSNASAGAWPEAVRMATEGELPLAELITHVLPVAQYAAGIDLVKSKSEGVIKVVLEW